MNTAAETAFLDILQADGPVTALVGDRIMWDSQEIDVEYPSVTIRTLSGDQMNDMSGSAGFSRNLIEIAAHSLTRLGASQLSDAVIAAFSAYGTRQTISGVTFGGVLLLDVTELESERERSYRKAARFSVHFYE